MSTHADEGLAKLLTDSQKQRISSALGSASQYEFAFPKGDGTAGEQLSVAYLKSKYGVVFEELDKTFADFVKNFTGSAEDLQKAIADESTVLAMLGDASAEILGKIPGLTIDGLRDMERAGDSPADVVQASVARSTAVRQYAATLWPTVDPKRVLHALWTDAELLGRHADGLLSVEEQRILLWASPPRTRSAARWSPADLVLLDELGDLRRGHAQLDQRRHDQRVVTAGGLRRAPRQGRARFQ